MESDNEKRTQVILKRIAPAISGIREDVEIGAVVAEMQRSLIPFQDPMSIPEGMRYFAAIPSKSVKSNPETNADAQKTTRELSKEEIWRRVCILANFGVVLFLVLVYILDITKSLYKDL
jgi:anti-sigma-K factor RskA